MTNLRCIIVDDERLARVEMAALLEEAGGCSIVGQAANAREAAALISEQQPDVIFLDINMPGDNGFALLETLDDCPLVVFVTAYDQYAIQAFEVHALDYLMKPVSADRLAITLRVIRERLGKSPGQRLFLSDRNGGRFIQLDDIYLVRAYDHYVRLYHSAGNDMLHQALSKFISRLPADEFFRANRSEVIRTSVVQQVKSASRGRYTLVLPGGEAVTISERQSVLWRKQFGS